jgi:hypothetical protein
LDCARKPVGGGPTGEQEIIVELTPEARAKVQALTRKGAPGVRRYKRAVALLCADAGDADAMIAVKAGLHRLASNACANAASRRG